MAFSRSDRILPCVKCKSRNAFSRSTLHNKQRFPVRRMRRILNNQYIPHSNMAAPVKEKHGESVTFSVSVLVNNDGKPQKTLVKNAIRKFQDTDTWFDVFDVACEAVELPKTLTENFEKYAQVQVSSDVSSTNVFDADPYDTIKTVRS